MRVNKYNLHKLHQRYILSFFFSLSFFSHSKTLILKDSSVRERALGFQRAINSIGSPQDEREREREREERERERERERGAVVGGCVCDGGRAVYTIPLLQFVCSVSAKHAYCLQRLST